ncbi:MAG: hypothetical protein ACR2M1_05225 [Gemmatimonadaceae bacterium]
MANPTSTADLTLGDLDAQATQHISDAEDALLETLMEDVFSSGFEPYEPNPYDGTYSEE